MADDDDGQERSEEPTGKRVEEFRSRGQLAKTQEISALMAIIMGVIMLGILGPDISRLLMDSIRGAFAMIAVNPSEGMMLWCKVFIWPVLKELLIFSFYLSLFIVISKISQTGIEPAWKSLEPKLTQFNPISGIQRMFSLQTFVQFVKSLLKVIVIGFIVYHHIKENINEILALSSLELLDATRWYGYMIAVIILKISIFLAIISVGDYLFQWHQTKKKMRMTMQEVKEERKQQEVSPHVRRKVRQAQMERSRREIQKEVPNADVVVTNPTHYAVAIRYRRFVERAPRVVAKGKDEMAHIIRDIAQKNNVPLYEYPVLARKLYSEVKVNQYIPSSLYEAVAKVLGFIYRLHKKKSGVSKIQPQGLNG